MFSTSKNGICSTENIASYKYLTNTTKNKICHVKTTIELYITVDTPIGVSWLNALNVIIVKGGLYIFCHCTEKQGV